MEFSIFEPKFCNIYTFSKFHKEFRKYFKFYLNSKNILKKELLLLIIFLKYILNNI